MKKIVFIKNAAILTVTALILRLAGIIFKLWLAGAVGSEGIGLYQLVMSVYAFAGAFASGGVCTAVTRLSADALASGSSRGAFRVLKKGIFISLALAFITLALLWFGGDLIADRVLCEPRAAVSLKILGFSLPAAAASSCIRGFFLARRKTLSGSLSQILEQCVRITAAVFLLGKFAGRGIAYACAAVVFSNAAAETVSCLVLFLSLRHDKRRLGASGVNIQNQSREIIRIAFPITAGRYLNSGLRAAENISVPKALALFGGAGLSQFGMIKGMALPLIFFPSSFLSAVSTLLIPEMSEAAACGRRYKIRFAAERALLLTGFSSFLIAAVFFAFSEPVGLLFYKSREVGELLRALAPLVPFMYLDSVCDGMLKGLDKQSFLFRVTVSDSAGRLLLVPLLVPKMGMRGFLLIMIISNIYTAAARLFMLMRTAEIKLDPIKRVLLPALCAAASAALAGRLYALLPFSPPAGLILSIAAAAGAYIAFLLLTGCVGREFIRARG